MALFTVYEAAAVLPNFTPLAPVKPVPVIVTEVPPPVEPEVGKILVIVGAVTNMLLVTAWPEKLASTPPSAATTVPAVYFTMTVLLAAMAAPDVVRSILVLSPECKAAPLKAWSAPPLISYLNCDGAPVGPAIAFEKVIVIIFPATLVAADNTVGAGGIALTVTV